ncbi:MAG: flagellar biosynthetic protein FliR [Oscillospiraceae bacterium]|nr:flagellar biosynthetic protein FliR [Oscillospiraceae bacterium]
MWESISSYYILFLLVLTRMSGVFLFNPFFGRKNVPAIIKIGLALLISVLITPTLGLKNPEIGSQIVFIIMLIKELFIGYVMGFVVNLLVAWVLMAGEMSDIQLGLGMSKLYDNQTNVSMPVTGAVFNIMLTLVFFAQNGHLNLIKIASLSCMAFPLGYELVNPEIGSYLTLLFGNILLMTVKLAAPIIAVELLTEIGMGIFMRNVPQVNVFVASIQVKLMVGLIIFIFVLPVYYEYLGKSIDFMFEKLEQSIILMLKS